MKGVEGFGVFVSGLFMEAVQTHQLTGLKKIKIWPKD
jgi:hypothetical protein